MTIATSQQIAPEAAPSPWTRFRTDLWQKEINVRDFIQQNYEPCNTELTLHSNDRDPLLKKGVSALSLRSHE